MTEESEAERELAELAEILRRAKEAAFAHGNMNAWLSQARVHRSKRGRDVCLANAIGWASR